jgi:hypothetical protein
LRAERESWPSPLFRPSYHTNRLEFVALLPVYSIRFLPTLSENSPFLPFSSSSIIWDGGRKLSRLAVNCACESCENRRTLHFPLVKSEVSDYIRINAVAHHPIYRNRLESGSDVESFILKRLKSGSCIGNCRSTGAIVTGFGECRSDLLPAMARASCSQSCVDGDANTDTETADLHR